MILWQKSGVKIHLITIPTFLHVKGFVIIYNVMVDTVVSVVQVYRYLKAMHLYDKYHYNKNILNVGI